ncbi:S-adenosyl-L-methionine-dependent methyltransferase [Delitschia confertaspora ATCC 74209]|uniref:S-adenosyl-L-methionine-dependent methyltransferase n=1 Tax=Delitschia confertaspora ATCC 74209 TaxID=1513339 RepID=A0A9P4JJC7_9PLEO|nr:S-adenosyl-L-methionine-dependent methyltransferase [Delitschia confertaspora ATCC 74209]
MTEPPLGNTESPLYLAERILSLTKEVTSHLDELSCPTPNFSTRSSSPPLTSTYESLRISLNTVAADLLRLINGPQNHFRTLFCTHYDLAAYQVALEFNFFELVPLEGGIAVADLAKKAQIQEDRVEMVMRFLATQKVFKESTIGFFEHTNASAVIAKEPLLKDAFSMQMDEMFRAASETSRSIQEQPYKFDSANSPFATRHMLSAYEYYEANREKGARFARAMAGVTQLDRQVSELRDEFPWETLGDGTLVDIGGGSGHIAVYLAKNFPRLKCVVQDISPLMLAEGETQLETSLKGRVSFQTHDFFQPQPLVANAYLIRQIAHNWNNDDAIRLFSAFIPALECSPPGTPLLINDTILPELGEKTAYEEHQLRQLDIAMWVVLGAKQRSEQQFAALLKEADPRLRIMKVHSKGSMGLMEVHLVKE